MPSDDSLLLDRRDGLPDSLRTLVQAFPRDVWLAHPNFHGMVQFWMDRHVMFRRILDAIRTDTKARVESTLAPEVQAARLGKLGGLFVNQLHGHHQIEDAHYFPLLIGIEPSLSRGFDILDRDHHAIDEVLNRFVERANALIGASADKAKGLDAALRLNDELEDLERFLNRHLLDEEELVVPIILKHGPDALEHSGP